jgi:hypothetical protein
MPDDHLGAIEICIYHSIKVNVDNLAGEVPNYDRKYVEHWIALALTTIPENPGNLDPVSKFSQVRLAPPATIYKIFTAENIIGCARVISERGVLDQSPNEK